MPWDDFKTKLHILIVPLQNIMKYLQLEEPDECEPPALPRVLILRYIDVPDFPVLLEQVLQVTVASSVRQIVDLQGYHPVERKIQNLAQN